MDPIIQNNLSRPEGTDKPHLVLMTGPEDAIAIPLGAKMFIVVDPDRADRIIPVFLANITRDALTFRCNCGQPKCTRVLSYKVRASGHHPLTENKQV
jgi:hypothetical protein